MSRPKKTRYTATIKSLGHIYEAKGTTVSEALGNLRPGMIKTAVVITLSDGKTKKERIVRPQIAARLFNFSGLAKEIALKQATTLFQGFDL